MPTESFFTFLPARSVRSVLSFFFQRPTHPLPDGERRRLGLASVRSLEKDGAYRDSNSIRSDAVISGDFIEELSWMRYHGSEYDSLDDGISDSQRMRDDEIDQAWIS
jgi:hypothetical protein